MRSNLEENLPFPISMHLTGTESSLIPFFIMSSQPLVEPQAEFTPWNKATGATVLSCV
jgi:hypothetical protein